MDTAIDSALLAIGNHNSQIDCLVVDSTRLTDNLQQQLTAKGVLLPVVVLVADQPSHTQATSQTAAAIQAFSAAYHGAVVTLPLSQLDQLKSAIQQAIQQFLGLSAESCTLPSWPFSSPEDSAQSSDLLPIPDLLSAQQERLTDKLKARLGYLGVYYKRNPDYFLRNMSQADRETLLNQLKANYRKIILGYFANDPKLNQNIDAFVNQTFLADISVSHIVEIHMELMDEFSKQLKLEGRSEEILLDYRLTLIDVIAHLCEMYRRSIPREP
ncbi:MAG: circadian clock protein KaiA [Leptolyngbyaceae cyanobacterium SM2_5_2]|nr:circadian clock protein KaiA [Leptolyngbyaceae cyanobacterium SM2_5_2]